MKKILLGLTSLASMSSFAETVKIVDSGKVSDLQVVVKVEFDSKNEHNYENLIKSNLKNFCDGLEQEVTQALCEEGEEYEDCNSTFKMVNSPFVVHGNPTGYVKASFLVTNPCIE